MSGVKMSGGKMSGVKCRGVKYRTSVTMYYVYIIFCIIHFI